MKCKTCITPIICECGCIPFLQLYLKKSIENKKINYTICGEACRSGIKERCSKCSTPFKIDHKNGCPGCGTKLVDTGCEMNDELQKLEKDKMINYLVGKTAPIIDISCVKCGAKWKYDRNKW